MTNGDAEWGEEAEDGGEVGGKEEWAGREREGDEEDGVAVVAVVAMRGGGEVTGGGGEGARFNDVVELERQLWSRSKLPAWWHIPWKEETVT